jgi:hypothetical protein
VGQAATRHTAAGQAANRHSGALPPAAVYGAAEAAATAGQGEDTRSSLGRIQVQTPAQCAVSARGGRHD